MSSQSPLASLLTRASVGPKYLTAPGPDRKTVENFAAFLSGAPCHDDTFPVRLVVVENREALGRAFVSALPADATEEERKKALRKAEKGPVCFALILEESPDVLRRARDEKLLSAGAVLMRLLDAVHAAGFAAKTVSAKDLPDPQGLYDPTRETLLAFVLCGTLVPEAKRSPRRPVSITYF